MPASKTTRAARARAAQRTGQSTARVSRATQNKQQAAQRQQARQQPRDQAKPRQEIPEPVLPGSDGPAAWLRWSTLVLSLIGLGVSIYLTYAHYTETALAGCKETTGVVNCGKVTTSPESVIFGIPVAVLGLAFFVWMTGINSPWAWRSTRREVALARLLSVVVGIGMVLYLVYAELFDIGSICLYCTSVHVITFLLFVLIGLGAAIYGFGAPRRTAD